MTDIRYKQLGTHLKVKDFDRSVAFYDAFGFHKAREFGPGTDAPETYRGVIYEIGDAYLELAEGHKPVKPEVFEERIVSSKFSMLVNVGSLVPVVGACREHEIDVVVPPRRFHWGQIEMVLRDPDGLVLAFSSPDTEEEVQALEPLFDLPVDREEPDYTGAHVEAIGRRA